MIDVTFEKIKDDHLVNINKMIGRGPVSRKEAISLFWAIRYNCLPDQWICSVSNHYEVIGKAAMKYRMGW